MACLDERRYSCLLGGNEATRAPLSNIFYLLFAAAQTPAMATLARYGINGSGLTEGMDKNGDKAGILHGFVSVLQSPLSWLFGEKL